MNVPLDQLDSNESILLMYLADELSPADRAEVERRLSVEANLRAEYEQLVAANDVMHQSFASLDAAQSLPGTAAASERQISRMIRQWQADRAAAEVKAPVESRPHILRRWWWMYPTAAAAAVLAFFIWWGIQQPGGDQLVSNPQIDVQTDNDPTPPNMTPQYVDNRTPSLDDASDSKDLNDAEKELEAVAYLRTLTQ